MKKILLGATIVVGVTVLAVMPTMAIINEKIELQNDKVGLAMSPMSSARNEMKKPGSSYSGRFRLRQTGKETNEVFVSIAPYSIVDDGENYDRKDYDSQNAYTKITGWVSLELEEGCEVNRREEGKIYLTMRSKEECYIKYSVEVPADAYGGSQHASILAQTVPSVQDMEGSGIINSYRIGYFLAADIDGPGAKTEGKVVEITIPQMLFTPPVRSSILVKNTGSLDFDVNYKMTVKNFFGEKEAYSKENKVIVLAETSRRISDEWEGSPRLGLFRVTEEVTLLGETTTLTKVVLVVPLALLVVLIAVIVLLALWIYVKVKKARRK